MNATRSSSDLHRATGLVLATGASDHEVFTRRIDGEPIAKSRVRVETSRVYGPDRTLDAELDIAQAIRLAPPPRFVGNVAVAAIFYRSNRHRIDVDNLLKTVLDGITKSGLVWSDDDQVTGLLGIVEYDPDWPRLVFAVAHHESTMLRGDDRHTHTCETCGTAYQPHAGNDHRSRYCFRDCRRTRVQICQDCGGPTSAPHVKRCRRCHDIHRGVRSVVA